uniref:Uncharacterized protein n=1 Tax=Globodera rostochiensis TaxID=31243 RepID=A0A914H1L4_GLORO
MEGFWILILVAFFVINSLDKAESVQLEELEELPLQTFDEIFGEGWWDKNKADEWDKLTLEHNFHHQIDGQNTQFGQTEPNLIDQNPSLTEFVHSGQIEPNSTDQLGQIEPNSTYQNPPLTESDHSDKAKNNEEISSNEKQKFDQRKAELIRAGFKNSYPNQINETVAKELGLSFVTIYAWKSEFGQSKPKHIYSNSEQKELLKRYYEIKDKTPKISDGDIAKMLKIGTRTLCSWKKQFKRQHFI